VSAAPNPTISVQRGDDRERFRNVNYRGASTTKLIYKNKTTERGHTAAIDRKKKKEKKKKKKQKKKKKNQVA